MSRVLVGVKLLPETVARIDAAADRMGRSRAATIEIMTRLYADGLDAETMIPAGAVPPNSRLPGQKRGAGKKLKKISKDT